MLVFMFLILGFYFGNILYYALGLVCIGKLRFSVMCSLLLVCLFIICFISIIGVGGLPFILVYCGVIDFNMMIELVVMTFVIFIPFSYLTFNLK